MDLREKALKAALRGNPLETAVNLRDQNVMDMVRRAIVHQNVVLAFQPVVTTAKGAEPRFYESLLRVLDETGRVIPARQFLPHLYHSEIARELDCLALDFSLRQLARHPDLSLSVNMSARSIGYHAWMDLLNSGLRKRPDMAQRLILELSEASVMELPELVIDFMGEQQSRGIAFALDDYGAGATSYKLLKDMFFDVIKVDGGFTTKIHQDPENQILAGAIAHMARRLDMQSVATRVETHHEARMMTKLGFTFLQGYFVGAPTISPAWDPIRKPSAVS